MQRSLLGHQASFFISNTPWRHDGLTFYLFVHYSAYCKSARLLRNHYWTFGKTIISLASQILGDLTVSCQSRYYYSRIWVCYCNHDIIKDVIIHPRHNINRGPKVRGHWHFCVTFLSESVNKNTIWYGILSDENFGLGQYMPQNLSVTHPLTLTGCTE